MSFRLPGAVLTKKFQSCPTTLADDFLSLCQIFSFLLGAKLLLQKCRRCRRQQLILKALKPMREAKKRVYLEDIFLIGQQKLLACCWVELDKPKECGIFVRKETQLCSILNNISSKSVVCKATWFVWIVNIKRQKVPRHRNLRSKKIFVLPNLDLTL